MAELNEKQFELGDVVFGWDCPVDIVTFQPGSAERRTNDTPDPYGDGVQFGKDRMGGATWTWTLFTNLDTEQDAWEAIEALQEAWEADDIRSTPGAAMPLRYTLAGQNRVVYGRPGRFTPTPGPAADSGNIGIEVDFRTRDQVVYGDEVYSYPMNLLPPLELDAGVLVPFIPPFTTTAGAQQRQGQFTVGGKRPTPLWIKIEGPVSDALVEINGTKVLLAEPVAANDPVTIDARPWVRAVTKQSGGGVRVNARVTRLAKLWVPPGTHDVIFTGSDLTGTAKLTVNWRHAYRAPSGRTTT